MIIVETVGIGQEAVPFDRDLVDRTVLVMSPEYGSRARSSRRSRCSTWRTSWW